MANLLSQNEVDSLMAAISTGSLPPAGLAPEPQKKMLRPDAKLYDFRHPVMFLKDQIRTLQMIHDTFARSFSNSMASYLRMSVKAKCTGVDQISYGEFILSLPEPCTVANSRFQPSEGRTLLAIHPAVGIGVLDRVTGGTGVSTPLNRPFTEIEQTIIEEFIAMALRDLEPAWNRILKVTFLVDTVESSAQFVQVASQEDTVVAATIEVNFGETNGILSLCYPFRALTHVSERLNAKHWAEEDSKAQAAKKKTNAQGLVNQIPLRVSARLGTVQITMQDLMQIKTGDVVLLNKDLSQAAELEIGGKVRFLGRVGARHGHAAIQIEERVV
jgi:flagellar motor switch protein FliM